MLRQIVRRIIRMNVSDTRKLDQTKGARQSWSCSMEYSLNNAGYVIMRIAGADYDGPKRKIGYVGFFVSVFGFVFFFETASP